MKLSKNTVLITGGSSGIGLEMGSALLKLGNKVILMGSDSAKLDPLKQEGFLTLECDLTRTEDIENASIVIQNNFPDINMVFNNAGVQYNYLLTSSVNPPDRISREIQINLTGQIILTQLLLPVLLNAETACIVNTTSGLGAFPKKDGLVYSASKAAMRSFTQGLRYSLKDTPVKVMELIPPVTDTAMTSGREGQKMSPRELVHHILPQLEREKRILTTLKMRFFLWIAFLFPGLAFKILDKQ